MSAATFKMKNPFNRAPGDTETGTLWGGRGLIQTHRLGGGRDGGGHGSPGGVRAGGGPGGSWLDGGGLAGGLICVGGEEG